MAKVLVLIVALAALHTVLGAPGERIIGGSEAEPGQFPYSVSMQYRLSNGEYAHSCGGSIIGNRTILTAAHCLRGSGVYRIYAGSNKLDGDGVVYEISSRVKSPLFDESRASHDVGLIYLQEEITFTPLIQPIELEPEHISADDTVTASGWGLIDYIPSVEPNELQFINLRTIDQEVCRDMTPNFPYLPHSSHLCVLNRAGEGLCMGDSGSPVVRNGKQIGLVSWSGAACARGRPDGLARVSSDIDWIRRNTV